MGYEPAPARAFSFSLLSFAALALAYAAPAHLSAQTSPSLRGIAVDATTGRTLPALIRVADDAGKRYTVDAAPGGTAVPYRKERGGIEEVHTCVSSAGFTANLEPGKYRIVAERGPEYLPAEVEVSVAKETGSVRLELRRFADMAADGWFSGDTHVHRPLDELPVVLLASDLNVACPLTWWVTESDRAPESGEAAREIPKEAIAIDETHLIWPRNTEYEIFRVGGKSHTLGAFFVIGHREILRTGVPPVAPIGEQARREDALIELDKHAWPWSMALVPILDVDLYELANNHLWPAGFLFRGWGEPPAPWMHVERNEDGTFTERGWIEYGLENYYALLDSGFRLRPTAGTASGVHPVPLGFSRVYVQCPGGLSWSEWRDGLDAGRSFVTTGPMLLATVEGELPGARIEREGPGTFTVEVRCRSASPPEALEVIARGRVRARIDAEPERTADGAYETSGRVTLPFTGSTWVAVRVFEPRGEDHVRFAHTGPVWIEVADRPLRPRREEVEGLISRVETEIERSRGVVPPAAIAEYERALAIYRERLDDAE